ncbi:MAG: hypothetical protein HC896_02520 [Bacteroidales bacterium]|nr:hypothetical protein [Bacteroidales bacterium]
MGRVNSCRAGGCSAPTNDAPAADSEYFDYFILFDSSGSFFWLKYSITRPPTGKRLPRGAG